MSQPIRETISGTNLVFYIALRKTYFQKDVTGYENLESETLTDSKNFLYFKVGELIKLDYVKNAGKTQKYVTAKTASIGTDNLPVMGNGEIVFKTIKESALKRMLKDISNGTTKAGEVLETITGERNPVTFGFSKKENGAISKWTELPYFDLVIMSNVSTLGATKIVKQIIQDVSVNQEQGHESIDSTEFTEFLTFEFIGDVESFDK